MGEHIQTATRKTFLVASTISANVPVKLDSANPGYVLAATAATDVIIGFTNTDSTADGRVSVILSAPVKTMIAKAAIPIGSFCVLDAVSPTKITAQVVNLAGANHKWSVGIALEAALAEDNKISVLQLTGFIPV